MEKIYIQKIEIKKVRHLSNEKIDLSKEDIGHLIITGKNGSGKTSVLDALSELFDSMSKHDNTIEESENSDEIENKSEDSATDFQLVVDENQNLG